MKPLFSVVATVHDPLTDGDLRVASDTSYDTRSKAVCSARIFSSQGYWVSIYDSETGECLDDFSPEGGQ